MPNFERLTGCLWAAWDGDNLELTASDPGSDDPHRHVIVQAADVPDLLAFIERRHPRAVSVEVVPGVVGKPPAAAAPKPAPPSDDLATTTDKRLADMVSHPGPFQTEAVIRLLHQRTTALEASAAGHGDRRRRVDELVERVDKLEARRTVTVEDLDRALNGPQPDGSPPPGDVVGQRLLALENALEGEDGITATVAETAVAMAAMQERLEKLQSAATAAPALPPDVATRGWVLDEIGNALRKHAGAMHEAIARSARNLLAQVELATQPRPGLARRLIAAAFAGARDGAQTRPTPPPAGLSPDALVDIARTGVKVPGGGAS